ncbi:MAG: endo-1,4-beta-xylanase [Saprospiraceae bacterium]
MKKIYYLLAFLFINFTATAQDAYHSQLEASFLTTYQIPIGEWVFFDNEAAIINAAGSYGGNYIIQESTDTDFSQYVKATISNAGNNAWDAGWNMRNQQKINAGDKVLIVFSIRSVGGTGKVNIFAENASTFDKEMFLTVDVSEEWTHYFVPFKSTRTYNANAMVFGFHLAAQAQTIEIGGYTAMNFANQVTLDDLPNQVNNDQYDGFQADAPWRTTAAENIDKFRKANLNIQVKNTAGAVVEGAAIEVKMLQHEFAFGSAVNANKIGGNNAQNNIYENKIINLDGKGHGFNWVVFENDLKWPAWEDNWFVSNDGVAKAVQWLRGNNIKIRGHTLVWPGANNMPNDISQNQNNIPYIKERIDGHLADILNYPGIKGEIEEWDVLNEITSNRSIENYFKGKEGYTSGREYLAEIFKKTREIDSNTGLWLNDYVTISTNSKPGNGNYDNLKKFTRELLDAGVALEGLGFQGHIGGFPNGIPAVLAVLDDFHNEFGLKAKITEFDMPTFVDEATAAQYLGDFLTAIYSHESMDGFLFWSFWDGATWIQGGTKSNFFQQNWTANASLEVFVNLVFNEWWTDETITSTADGLADIRAFKGMYEIVYEADGETIRDTINLTADTNLEIIGNNITTSIEELTVDNNLAIVYPNPATNQLTIERSTTNLATIQLFDVTGKKVVEQVATDLKTVLKVAHLKGIYLVKIADATRTTTKKVMIR